MGAKHKHGFVLSRGLGSNSKFLITYSSCEILDSMKHETRPVSLGHIEEGYYLYWELDD
jgi:hypothetical protein